MATKPKSVKQKTKINHFTKWLWILFGAGILMIILVFLLASFGAFGKMPDFADLENPKNDLATEIIASDGKIIGTFFKENRTPVDYEQLPDHLIKALVATEDERYYKHSGIDARGTIRAIAYLGKKGGASTITQQLSKLLFHGERAKGWKRYLQKFKEWVIAIRLERQYTKDEIIAMYLNKFDFLYQAVGISSASRIYFGKEVEELNIEESASLVAMLKNPILYNPQKERFKKNNLSRRNQVFKQMEKNGYITTKVKDSLQKLPLELNYSPEGHSDGIATYFREYLREFMKDWIEANPKSINDLEEKEYYNIYRDGLKIHVTIDSRMQTYAEEAVKEHMSNLQSIFDKQNRKNRLMYIDVESKDVEKNIKRAMKRSDRYRIMKKQGKTDKAIFASFDKKRKMRVFSWKGAKDTIMTPKDSIWYYKSFFQTGMMSMEPQTGHVKAWVGGNDYKFFQYDHVKQGKRQVGSTFKPFVYATAIDQLKLSPCDTIPNVQYTIPAGRCGAQEDWTPRNSGDKYGGMLTLKDALARSVNTVTARIMSKICPVPVVQLAKKLGVETEIPEVPSIALGSVDLSVYEMVGAYGTFANEGVYNKPTMVTHIEDKNGTTLYQNVPDPKDVINKEAAYVTVNLMEGVTQSGSGARLRTTYRRNDLNTVATGYPYKFTNPIAGKTGTTQNQSDGWFMGIVPNLCTGVWVGAEDRSTHFDYITYGQGAAMALPIWGLYMKKCYADNTLHVSKGAFEKPTNLSISTDCSSYKKATNDDDLYDDLDGLGNGLN